jgi:hypothetical protein
VDLIFGKTDVAGFQESVGPGLFRRGDLFDFDDDFFTEPTLGTAVGVKG